MDKTMPSDCCAQKGFSYIGLLILIAIMGVALAATGDLWQTASQREKEVQLLFVGDQIRLAIKRFQRQPGVARRYPMSLDDLLLDPRFPNPHRYLRRIYVDPMTGTTDWGLVRGPNGDIYGVYSHSEEKPIKQANFRVADNAFEKQAKYSDWKFLAVTGQNQTLPSQTQPANRLLAPVGGKL
jgi:type II secretory pathway pseudopilin PulG